MLGVCADTLNTEYFFAINSSNHLQEANLFIQTLYPYFGVFAPLVWLPGYFLLVFGTINAFIFLFNLVFTKLWIASPKEIAQLPLAVGLPFCFDSWLGVLSWWGLNVFQIMFHFKP